MPNDDPRSAPPPVDVEIAPMDSATMDSATMDSATIAKAEEAVMPPDRLAVEKAAPPELVEPETLALGLRYVQQRIPGFTQLSLTQKQSMARTAYLDPAFVEVGVHIAGVWNYVRQIIQRGGEELGVDAETVRRWDVVIRELRALTNGIAGANLVRKHRLGKDVLKIYGVLGSLLRLPGAEDALRPYYEEMQSHYRRRQTKKRKPRKSAKKDDPDTPKE
jgi:hypothetical protein